MKLFFDKIAFRIFLYSLTVHKAIFGRGENRKDAKIQTLFIVSLSQSLLLILTLLQFVLVYFFDTKTPLYVELIGCVILLAYNYSRYYKGHVLDDFEANYSSSMFFKSNAMTNIIALIYLALCIISFLKTGDFVRNSLM